VSFPNKTVNGHLDNWKLVTAGLFLGMIISILVALFWGVVFLIGCYVNRRWNIIDLREYIAPANDTISSERVWDPNDPVAARELRAYHAALIKRRERAQRRAREMARREVLRGG
jgi:hypothetical protein